MINWVFFPKSQDALELVRSVVRVFERASAEIDETPRKSDSVLAIVRLGLQGLGLQVEQADIRAR